MNAEKDTFKFADGLLHPIDAHVQDVMQERQKLLDVQHHYNSLTVMVALRGIGISKEIAIEIGLKVHSLVFGEVKNLKFTKE